jgi:hypothetical protein
MITTLCGANDNGCLESWNEGNAAGLFLHNSRSISTPHLMDMVSF